MRFNTTFQFFECSLPLKLENGEINTYMEVLIHPNSILPLYIKKIF